MKKRCCIYCRVLDKEGIKLLDYQEQVLTDFAKEKDFNLFYTFLKLVMVQTLELPNYSN